MVASTLPCVKSAPARPDRAMVAQPNNAAMATVISRTASTDPPILPRLSTAFVRVNAPTMATNTSGMTSMRSKSM